MGQIAELNLSTQILRDCGFTPPHVPQDKIRRLLPEFKPRWNARRDAEELYEAYRVGGLVIEDCEGPRLKRIDHLKHLLATRRVDERLRWRTA